MSNIRVRRSGLISFSIKLGSTLTGLAFVVLVTSNLSVTNFGLWQLISRVIAYVVFFGNILYFWTTRYRARGMQLGKSVLVGAAVFSAFLSILYLIVSYGVAGTVSTPGGYSSNLFYFLFSAPQVPLYVFAAIIEAILWGSRPERASFGFGLFEIAKVIIGGIAVGVFHLSLEGAILGVMGAQIVQIVSTLVMTHGEYGDHVSIPLIAKMVRTGWVAILNQVQSLVITFDLFIVAVITSSPTPIAFFAAASVFASIITYSGWIAAGLYTGILAGKDPGRSTSQILELQYAFIFPMVIGELILAPRLLHLLNPAYTQAAPILLALAIGSALAALSQTFDNVITGTDTTDAMASANFSLYLKSKLFLVAKINISLAIIYLIAVSIIARTYEGTTQTYFGFSSYLLLGILWGIIALFMWAAAVGLKIRYVRVYARILVPLRTGIAIIAGAAGFAVTLYFLNLAIPVHGGEIVQALLILLIGVISISVYAGIVLLLSDNLRRLVKYAISDLI